MRNKVMNGVLAVYTASMNNIKSLSALAMAAMAMAIMPMPAMAASGSLSGVLQSIGGLCITVVAIVGVIFIVKFAVDMMKNGGSVGKVIISVLTTLLLIGLIVTLMNIDSIQGIFGGVAGKAVETTGQVAEEALG